ncbi:MAG: cell wall hydrolase [Hyphomicrobiales bacterium]
MSIRASRSLRALLAAVVLLPVLAVGYLAAEPDTLPEKLRLALQGETAMRLPAAVQSFWLTAAEASTEPDEPRPGPRTTVAYRSGGTAPGIVKVASAEADDMVTGSLPSREYERPLVVTVKKTDRYLTPPEARKPLPKPEDVSMGASLYLTSFVKDLTPYSPEVEEDDEKIEAEKKAAAERAQKGVTYRGETEAEFRERERRCLATAIYFEARGEPVGGQKAVAQVVMNRVRSPEYPDTICGVVYQGQHRRTGCQFSFTCDGKADVAKDEIRWQMAMELARKVTSNEVWLEDIGHATHYHANYVSPRWIREMKRIQTIGAHIFYRLRNEKPYEINEPQPAGNPERGLAYTPSG